MRALFLDLEGGSMQSCNIYIPGEPLYAPNNGVAPVGGGVIPQPVDQAEVSAGDSQLSARVGSSDQVSQSEGGSALAVDGEGVWGDEITISLVASSEIGGGTTIGVGGGHANQSPSEVIERGAGIERAGSFSSETSPFLGGGRGDGPMLLEDGGVGAETIPLQAPTRDEEASIIV